MAGPIRIAILANGRQARSEAALTARAYGVMGRRVSSTAKLIGGVFAVAGLVRVGKAVGQVGASYVDSLNKIQALTGSTDSQMAKLADRVESQSSVFAKYGQTTGDAAAGMVELAKSGLSAQKSIGAIRGTMLLAKAGELEVADASTLVANTLNTFGLKAKAASKIANSLANAANISSADVSDLAESFKYVAPLAAKAGLSVDQTNAALAELANSGIKASQAGTTMRGMLVALQAPSTAGGMWLDELGVKVYGAGGKMRDFGSILEDLRTGIAKVSDEDANFALKSIFGRNSITGASVLIKGGTKALDEYTKGVKRAGAADKLAASASKGLAGTLKSLKSQVISTVQELYRRYSPALDARIQSVVQAFRDNKDEISDLAETVKGYATPALKSLASMTSDHVYPALKSTMQLAKDTAEAFGSGNGGLAKSIGQTVVDALSKLADLVKTAADGLDRLPAPIKSIGVQAGIAALILPRLTLAVTSVSGSLLTAAASARTYSVAVLNAETRSTALGLAALRLGAMAKTAAGVAGLVALTQGAKESNKALSLLELTAGGAATGFSVAGPWGAAVGGGIGAALGAIKLSTDDAKRSLQLAKPAAAEFADALNQVSGAATSAARDVAALSLQQSGALTAGRALGIGSQDLVGYVLGQEKAVRRVTRAMANAKTTQISWTDQYGVQHSVVNQASLDVAKLNTALGLNAEQLQKDQAGIRERAIASGRLSRQLKDIKGNSKIVARIESRGWPETARQIARVTQGIKLTPKQTRLVIKALGADATLKDILRVRDGVKQGMNQAKRSADDGARQTGDALDKGVKSGTGKAAGSASSGGRSVGANLKSGIFAGFAGTANALAAQAAGAVRQAVAAARAAGKIHSPSKVMHDKVGAPLAQGIVTGFVHGVTKGESEVKSSLDKLMGVISSRLDGKKQAGRRKSLLKSLKDERTALITVGRTQDQNNKNLDKAIAKYKALKQRADQFAASIKSGFQSYGSIVGLGTLGGGTAVTSDALISQLTARAQVASRFAAIIDKLRGKLNKTSLKQLLDTAASGDLEGALVTAQAISSGGGTAINQINQLTSQITAVGGKLGTQMRHDFYGAGLHAADGLVEGLKARKKQIEKIAEFMAKALVDKVKRALGIHSPSRVFAQIGALTADGITVGIKARDTHVRRSGAALAASLQKGYGTPALDAYMSSSSSSASAPQSIRIKLSAQQVSQLQRGREIQADLDIYRGNGGRSKVRVK